jgi:four helix bundle protein
MGFRFETLEVYQDALKISGKVFVLVEELQMNKLYVFADQLSRACLSITNNIAEGSGSNSEKDFAHFLNIARRSVFECVNIIIILNMRSFISLETKNSLNYEFDILSRKIQNLRKSLL